MKNLTVFFLLLMVIICVAHKRKRSCASYQGPGRAQCVSVIRNAPQQMCKRKLDLSCESKVKICCVMKTKRTSLRQGLVRASVKRKCNKKYRKPCLEQNGVCVHYKNNDCTTRTDSSLCKGASCTCCLNSYVSECKSSRKCTKSGGNCISKTQSSTCKGKLKNKLCKDKKCTCCLPEKCKSSRKCTESEGRCISKTMSSTCKGKLKNKLCSNKECSCCLPEETSEQVCQCGLANEERIIGGEVVSPNNKYPWMVGILFTEQGLPPYGCGGSIIKDNYILTAAHCVDQDLKPSEVFVAIADHDQFSADDNISGVTKLVEVEELILNENYNVFADRDSDIALVKLKEPLNLSTNKEVKPVCLPEDDSKTYEGENAIVAGWGTMTPGLSDPSNELMELTVPILSPACESGNLENFDITQNMLCAGFIEGEKDACQGDSGGPLVVKEGEKYVQVGVVSFGKGCAEPDLPGVYTRVSKYLDWIETNTKDGLGCS